MLPQLNLLNYNLKGEIYMKTIWTLFLTLFLSLNFATAQDTLYVYKAGAVIYKQAVSDVDSVTFYKPYFPTQGLIAWWPFNGNGNDMSGNGNNGTVHGATLSSDRFGITNRAYSFNGISNYIDVPNATVLNPTTALTISVWVQSTSTQGNAGIIGKWNNFGGASQNGQEQYTITTGSVGKTGLTSYLKTVGKSQSFVQEVTNTYNNGNWNHFVSVWDGTSLKLYKNNALLSTSLYTGIIPSYNQALEIGRYAGGQMTTEPNNNYFNGKIDDIGIWNRALTLQEISNLYNSK
jgi:hypothetical protein